MTLKPKNCAACGRIFLDPAGRGYCPECIKKREEQMNEIASYVRDNPRSSITEICAALGVKKSLVIYMLQSGRLEETGINVKYPCASCGKLIYRGRYCKACGQKITGEIAARTQRMRRNPKKPADQQKKGVYSKEQWLDTDT